MPEIVGEVTDDVITSALSPLTASILDRPSWIPPHIIEDWDSTPYAYQTEEERLPAGGPQGRLLAYITELLRHVLQTKDLMLLMDFFLLYRDQYHLKQRVSPDLLLMPYRDPPPSAHDLDHEPPPRCVIEVTSSGSHTKDLQTNVPFYIGLGISTYLVIDAITPQGQLREQIELHLWRSVHGQPQRMLPDGQGRFTLAEMGLKMKAIGQRLIFSDVVTDDILFDNSQLLAALAGERQAGQADRQNIALALWQQGLTVEMIVQATGLSQAELNVLIENH